VSWDPAAAHLDDGAVVVGGVPRRIVRLSRTARRELDALAGDRSHRVPTEVATRLIRPLLDAGILHPAPGPAALGPEAVTVVIPARDRASALQRLLPGLAGFARVLVVDDGSTDDTGAVAAALGAEVLRRDRPGGPAAARNAGLELVGTDLVAFIDSDIRLEPGWEGPVLAHLNDPTIAVAAPRVKGDAASRTDALARYEVARSPQDVGPHPGYVRSGNRVSFLPAAVLVARTEVVRAHGGFDIDLIVGEDVDFVWRLAAAGWRIRYEPAAVTFHDARPDLARLLRRRVDYGTSAAALHRRHPGKVAPIGVSPWSIAVWGAALLGRPRIAVALAAATALRLGEALRGKLRERWRAARLVATGGHLGAARILASALARTWLPLALLAMKWRRPRAALAAFLAVPPLADWLERRPPIDPTTYTLLHVADDAAYCAGVWAGCLRHRTAGPLLPRLYRQEPIFPRIEPAPGAAIASKASGSRDRDEEA
jgi:mycofactocin system glycosyltransferase